MRQGLYHPLPGWYGFAQHEPLHCWWGSSWQLPQVEVSTQMKNPQKDSPKVHHFPKYFHMILSTCGVQELKEFRRAVSKALEKEPNAPLPMWGAPGLIEVDWGWWGWCIQLEILLEDAKRRSSTLIPGHGMGPWRSIIGAHPPLFRSPRSGVSTPISPRSPRWDLWLQTWGRLGSHLNEEFPYVIMEMSEVIFFGKLSWLYEVWN